MSETFNSFTGIIKKATDVLMIFNPRGTCLGIAFGGFLKTLAELIDPFLVSHQLGNLAKMNPVYLFLTGIFLFNISTISQKNRLDPKFEKAIAEIKYGVLNGLISKANAQLQYTALINEQVKLCVIKEPIKSGGSTEAE